MLSYRHAFHAGNFADVFKHLVLSLLIKAQLNKEKPFFYLDSHAGAGRYDLFQEMAQKNKEYASGIERVWHTLEPPAEIEDYLAAVRACNETDKLRFYPGSPWIARYFLRPFDRMALCDLHSTDCGFLKREFVADKRVTVHAMDGYQGLKAFLPPLERRGVVLCDPAYELKDERTRLLDALTKAWKRWPNGVYAVWYPIQDKQTVDWFYRQFKRSGIGKVLLSELRIADEDTSLRMVGTGMIVINPPWRFDEQMQRLGPWLWKALSMDGKGGFRLDWLAPE